ncbi:MAG: hypothetical protein EOO29_53165, partial [Comamonadaceae bacterium]
MGSGPVRQRNLPGARILSVSSRPFLRPVDDHRNTPPGDEPGQAGPHRYLLISQSEPHRDWLGRALWEQGRVLPAPAETSMAALDAQIAHCRPQALFLDFCGSAPELQALPKGLTHQWPHLPMIGMGRASEPASMLAALRAGVHDFVDLDAAHADAQAVVVTVLARRPAQRADVHGQTLALLGARSGLG